MTPSTISATVAPNCSSELFLRGRRVLDDVVQDRRDDRVGIEVQVGEDLGGRERVRDVRLAAEPLLALVRLGAEFSGRAHALDLSGGR